MPITTLFWDNDGVLVDTEHLYFEATAEILRGIGIPLTEQDYVQLFLIEGRGAWHLAAERGWAAPELERLREARNALYGRRLAEQAEAIPGVEGVLDKLRGRYRMGVVTSSRRDHFDIIHARTGLARYFDFILTAGDFPRVKPHPDPYLAALARSGAAAAECLAIEDSARGLAAAKAAGIRCLVVPTALTRGCTFTGAERVLSSIEDVLTVLS